MDSVESSSPTSAAEAMDVVDDGNPSSKSSALADNITKKGKNAYYYAHAHKATGPKWDGKIEPRILGTSSSNLSVTSSAASTKAALMAKSNITNYAFLDETTKVKIYVNLPGVGGCKEEEIGLEFTESSLCLTVRNYVATKASSTAEKKKKASAEALVADTAPAEGGAPAEEDEKKFDKDELGTAREEAEERETTDVEGEAGEERCLSFGKLFGEIEKATFKKKPDKVIITLKKKDERTWKSVIA